MTVSAKYPLSGPGCAAAMVCFAASALTFLYPARALAARASEQQLLQWMGPLKPLQKTHYSWPLPMNSISDDLLFEYARLTNAISIRGEGHTVNGIDVTTETIQRAVQTCNRVNAARPIIRCSIGVNYSVWHRRFGKGLPPTDVGSTHGAELRTLRRRFQRISDDLAAANANVSQPVRMSAVLFDSERFNIREGDTAWNNAITSKHNLAFSVATGIFRDARIEWYSRGGVAPATNATGWRVAQNMTLQARGNSYGATLYRVPEIDTTRESYRRTFDNASDHDIAEVTPWIALAAGYRRGAKKFHSWSFDWNYDIVYSWQLGLEVNQRWWGHISRYQRFAPWSAAKIAVFYPEPFGRVPHWGQHFVAYVRGANLNKNIDDLKPGGAG